MQRSVNATNTTRRSWTVEKAVYGLAAKQTSSAAKSTAAMKKKNIRPQVDTSTQLNSTQPGYVIFAGRKVPIDKPHLRARGGSEASLQSYAAFQQNGRLQRAVA